MKHEIVTPKTIDTLRTFAQPALVIGLLKKDDLDRALQALENIHTSRAAENDRLVTFREAARQLGVSTRTVARMLHSGELRGKRLRPHHRNTMRILQSSIDQIFV